MNEADDPDAPEQPLPPAAFFPSRSPDSADYLSDERFSPGVTVIVARPGEPAAPFTRPQQGKPSQEWAA